MLRDCQERRTAVIRPRRRRVEELQRRLMAAGSDKERIAAVAAVDQERDALSRRIDEIFEQQLKPRLERIPNRAQRQAALGRAPPARP